MATLKQKLAISLGSAAVFTAVNLQQTYKFTNNLVPNLALFDGSCPTNAGLLAHAVVFFILTLASMGDPGVNTGIKIKHSLYGTLIMFLLSNPVMYTLTGNLFGPKIATNGCPTLMGVLLHAAVYCIALVGVMYLPNKYEH
jgi:hypothetical protein